MFKSKISAKLSLYFGIALLIFAIVIGSIFIILFRNQSLNAHKMELESHAIDISQTLSSYLDTNASDMRGFGMYLRMIGDIAGTDVWIIDTNQNLITGGKGRGQIVQDYFYKDLPENAEQLIKDSFKGQTVFSEDFSNVLSELTLTVGMPIFNNFNEVIGVVLLHSPVEGIDEAISQGIIILIISIVFALIVSFLLSLIFANSFTKPLTIMENTALRLVNGEYTAKANIKQDDEIGELANTIDILADRLDAASYESEKLENMRREFIANISHELKTPITVIRGSLEALVDEIVTNPLKIQEYHIQMLNESKFLQRLVDDLLELSKLQSMDFTIEKTKILICDLMDDVIRSASHIAKKEEVEIEFIKKINDCSILGDYGRIRQMIMVILDNAIKFSPKNDRVKIILEEGKLSIKDNGIGISAGDLPYIFERFYKSRSEENKTGTGLGLSIAKNIAGRHDIELIAESEKGKGTKFTFVWDKNKISQKEQTKDIVSS